MNTGNKTSPSGGGPRFESEDEPIPLAPPPIPRMGKPSGFPPEIGNGAPSHSAAPVRADEKPAPKRFDAVALDLNDPHSFLSAAESGDPLAMAVAGDSLCWGGFLQQGIPRDIKRGYAMLSASGEHGSPLGTYLLSRAQRLVGNFRQPVRIADATERRAFELGFPNDLTASGPVWKLAEAVAFREGRIVEVDLARQFNLIQSCLNADYTDAWTAFALCLLGGEGVQPNLPEGIRWLRRAAEAMNGTAMMSLGNCYRNGIGVSKNPSEAINWYRKASENGQDDGLNSLGYCARKGIGCKRSDKEALKYYRAAAEESNPSGCYNLGFAYEKGLGAHRSKEEALRWYRLAASLGHAKATEATLRLDPNP